MEPGIQTKILGVRIDSLGKEKISDKVKYFLNENKFHQIATVNPEFILEAQSDAEFKKILNGSDLCVADGAGIWFAFLRYGKILKARTSGADLMEEILKIASEKSAGIFLAASKDGLSLWKETRDAILKKHPGLKISGADLDKNSPVYKMPDGYVIVFCNFGAPYQEKFIDSIKNDNMRLAMGVGGSFDFLTGKIRRAPKFMRVIALEWLWRLIQQPKRIKRIFNAVIIFPIKIIFTSKSI